MKIFKEIMSVVNRTIAPLGFGFAMPRLFIGEYEMASWIFFGASILFMIGYFTERFSK